MRQPNHRYCKTRKRPLNIFPVTSSLAMRRTPDQRMMISKDVCSYCGQHINWQWKIIKKSVLSDDGVMVRKLIAGMPFTSFNPEDKGKRTKRQKFIDVSVYAPYLPIRHGEVGVVGGKRLVREKTNV